MLVDESGEAKECSGQERSRAGRMLARRFHGLFVPVDWFDSARRLLRHRSPIVRADLRDALQLASWLKTSMPPLSSLQNLALSSKGAPQSKETGHAWAAGPQDGCPGSPRAEISSNVTALRARRRSLAGSAVRPKRALRAEVAFSSRPLHFVSHASTVVMIAPANDARATTTVMTRSKR